MGFSSLDDLTSEITAGKFIRADWNKITGGSAYTAGRWYDFSGLAGTPVANAWAGTALAWTTCTETTGNGTQIFGIPHGGNVSTDTKHILNAMAVTAVATGVPGVLMFVDLQGYWPGITNNSGTAQTLTGTPTLRYASGAGCRLFAVQTATNGATAQNIAVSYTDQAGNTGNTLPVTVAMTASTIVGHIGHSGTAANNYGPFLPLASGDTGVQNVATVTMSAANTGTFALCLARPLFTLPITTASVATERDLVNQLPSLPRIIDGACIVPLFFAGAATAASTNFYGAIEAAWG
ncbi:MAG: hypothetical protein ACRC1H_03510 [Caldilineaceae bacterium]